MDAIDTERRERYSGDQSDLVLERIGDVYRADRHDSSSLPLGATFITNELFQRVERNTCGTKSRHRCRMVGRRCIDGSYPPSFVYMGHRLLGSGKTHRISAFCAKQYDRYHVLGSGSSLGITGAVSPVAFHL